MVPWNESPPFKTKDSGSLTRASRIRVAKRANPPIHGATEGLQTPPDKLVSTNLELKKNFSHLSSSCLRLSVP